MLQIEVHRVGKELVCYNWRLKVKSTEESYIGLIQENSKVAKYNNLSTLHI